MYIMGNVKKRIINTLNEDFSKPAVIICNHQSSLDIVPLIMLHPKILMFTNNKKWNAPFFGPVIRMADYFPAEQVDEKMNLIADRVKHGYSLVVFPETKATEIWEAQKDALLKDGQVTLKFLPRIKADDVQLGNGYVERSKSIGRYFRQEFNMLRNEIEQPAYFREKLIYNYLYKGPLIEWYMRIKTRLEKNYVVFHELVPKQGKILDIGCGYGFMSYLLYFTSTQRNITGIDFDEEKIETANHCFSKTADINFIHSDVLSYPFEKYDAIIMADMLHYLQPDEQIQVIEKCINQLNPAGIVIIRDGDIEAIAGHKKTELTEFLSTRLLGFNKYGEKGLSFLSGKSISEIAARHDMGCDKIRDSKFTSNTIFVLKKKEGA